jgi:hypothetical protein
MVEKKKGERNWAERDECGGGPTRERGRLGSFGWANGRGNGLGAIFSSFFYFVFYFRFSIPILSYLFKQMFSNMTFIQKKLVIVKK